MELNLIENTHPNKDSINKYNNLIGIDVQKGLLLDSLNFLFKRDLIESWEKKHHKGGFIFLQNYTYDPLIILSGEVGCGKTELANTIPSIVSEKIGKRIKVFETPSNIRGSGLVGEISNRISAAFKEVKMKIKHNEFAILIIDEGDDLATSRAQNQAHHEDRAGLNVLIKEIDSIKKSHQNIIVILITNREKVLDAAFYRRAILHLKFERPNEDNRKKVFEYLFGNNLDKDSLTNLMKASKRQPPYSYSDLIQKVGTQTLFKAISTDKPFTPDLFCEVLKLTDPTPLL